MDSETDGTNTARSTAKRVGKAAGRAAGSAARATRETIRRNPTANRVYRTGVGVVGGGTVALGVVLIPLPGPGSLIAVGGLAMLATEFEGAKRASAKANAAARKGVAIAKEQRAKRQAKKAAKGAAPVD
ncbi:PGPGW domain-containing protein [Plantibacter flavus]|uniref:PGPGW domain-containing protein n=1 Tax=Plantibacter flavus TaxID=150123 RepID=UPI003F17159F